jgi:hypothetical protein
MWLHRSWGRTEGNTYKHSCHLSEFSSTHGECILSTFCILLTRYKHTKITGFESFTAVMFQVEVTASQPRRPPLDIKWSFRRAMLCSLENDMMLCEPSRLCSIGLTNSMTRNILSVAWTDSEITKRLKMEMKSMEQNPSWEINSLSASQEIPSLYWTRRFITVFTRATHQSL